MFVFVALLGSAFLAFLSWRNLRASQKWNEVRVLSLEVSEFVKNIPQENAARFLGKKECWNTMPGHADAATCGAPGKKIRDGWYELERTGIPPAFSMIPVAAYHKEKIILKIFNEDLTERFSGPESATVIVSVPFPDGNPVPFTTFIMRPL